MEIIREQHYTTSTISLQKENKRYWVVMLEKETEVYPEFVDKIGFDDIVDAAIYYGKLQGQYITEM